MINFSQRTFYCHHCKAEITREHNPCMYCHRPFCSEKCVLEYRAPTALDVPFGTANDLFGLNLYHEGFFSNGIYIVYRDVNEMSEQFLERFDMLKHSIKTADKNDLEITKAMYDAFKGGVFEPRKRNDFTLLFKKDAKSLYCDYFYNIKGLIFNASILDFCLDCIESDVDEYILVSRDDFRLYIERPIKDRAPYRCVIAATQYTPDDPSLIREG